MKQEKKIFYEAILEERKDKLKDLIHRCEITKITVRNFGSYADIKSKSGYFIYVFKSFDSIYIACIEKLFEMKLLNCDINKDGSEDAFIIFCKYFRKLIKEIRKSEEEKNENL